MTGANTGVPILDSIAANDLQKKEAELANQRLNMNHAMDQNDALNKEKEKVDKNNKEINNNLQKAKDELEKVKQESKKIKDEAMMAKK